MSEVWARYRVALQIEGRFGASIPRSTEEIRAMLEHRMPTRKPDDAAPIDELAESVAAQVDTVEPDEDGFVPGWATFLRDADGNVLYEARCVRGHIKDCALQVKGLVDVKNFRAKVANATYIRPDEFVILRKGKPISEPDGSVERFIQVMTRQGPRSSIKYVDYVTDPVLEFTMLLSKAHEITPEHLGVVFEYGGIHGIGAERSQEWGQYTVKELKLAGEGE